MSAHNGPLNFHPKNSLVPLGICTPIYYYYYYKICIAHKLKHARVGGAGVAGWENRLAGEGKLPAYLSQQLKRHLDRFSCLCRAHKSHQQSDHATPCAAADRYRSDTAQIVFLPQVNYCACTETTTFETFWDKIPIPPLDLAIQISY